MLNSLTLWRKSFFEVWTFFGGRNVSRCSLLFQLIPWSVVAKWHYSWTRDCCYRRDTWIAFIFFFLWIGAVIVEDCCYRREMSNNIFCWIPWHCFVSVAQKYLFSLSLYSTCIFILQGAIMEDALQRSWQRGLVGA